MTRMYIKAILIIGAFLIATPGYGADIFNGKKVYKSRCAMCHGDDGKGMMPGAPDFRRGQKLNKSDARLIKQIKKGKGSCPPFEGIIREKDMQDVISFLRTMRR